MANRYTVIVVLLVILIIAIDRLANLGIVSAMTDFLVVFIVVGILLGVIYSRGD